MRKLHVYSLTTDKADLLDDTTRELLGRATLDAETGQVRYDLNPEGTCYVIEQLLKPNANAHSHSHTLTMQSRLAALYREYDDPRDYAAA